MDWTVGYGPVTWRTFGQEYAISVQSMDNGSSQILLCSRPRLSVNRFDGGAGRVAVKQMQRALEQILHEEGIAS